MKDVEITYTDDTGLYATVAITVTEAGRCGVQTELRIKGDANIVKRAYHHSGKLSAIIACEMKAILKGKE